MDTPSPALPIAALIHAGHGQGDGLLTDFAYDLRAHGWRVHGLVQQNQAHAAHQKAVELIDICSGLRYPLFQNLGTGSDACSVDTSIIAAASVSLRAAIAQQADLTVINRFGALEAAGGGFSIEMLALMMEKIPVITIVAEQYLKDWRYFTGSAGTELPLERWALEQWFADLQKSRQNGSAA